MIQYYKTADEALENALNDNPDEYLEFNGMNCNAIGQEEHCEGWDKKSRRCQCGNRRVAWTATKYNGRWYAFAEAY